MRHFLIFPPLFAVWFAVAQFGLAQLSQMSLFLTLNFIAPGRVRFRLPLPSEWPLQFYSRAFVVGLIVGSGFAVMTCMRRGVKVGSEETLFRLLPKLLKSGAIAVALILLYYGAFKIPLSLHLSRIHHFVYTPLRAISSWSNFIPHILLFMALLWSMRKTLRQDQKVG